MQTHSNPQTAEIRSTNKKVLRAQGESDFESLLDVTEAAKLLRIHPKNWVLPRWGSSFWRKSRLSR